MTRGFSKDELKGKQLSPTFQPDALVIFRTQVKPFSPTRASGQNVSESCFPLSWSFPVPSFWSQLRIAVFILNTIMIIMGYQ